MESSRPEYWRGSCSLLQGIFPTQGRNPGLPHRRRTLYLAPVLLPGKSHGQRSLAGYSPRGRVHDLTTEQQQHISPFSSSSPLQGMTKYRVYFPALSSRFLLVECQFFLHRLLVNILECSEMISLVALHEVGEPAWSQGSSTQKTSRSEVSA